MVVDHRQTAFNGALQCDVGMQRLDHDDGPNLVIPGDKNLSIAAMTITCLCCQASAWAQAHLKLLGRPLLTGVGRTQQQWQHGGDVKGQATVLLRSAACTYGVSASCSV